MTTSRRKYLQTIGVAGTALLTGPRVSSAAEGPTPQLVFVYDDGPISDYSKAFPVHRAEGAPACVGAISALVSDTGSGMDRKHLLELQDAGWEIMSHTVEHRALGRIEVTADIEPGDTTIEVAENLHGANPGDTIIISDDMTEERATVTGAKKTDGTEWIVLEDPVENAYSTADGTYECLSDEVLEEAIVGSKAQLEEMGLQIDNFVYPYGRRGPRAEALVREHYDGVANYDFNGINPGVGVDPYRVGRNYFRENVMTEPEIETFLDRVKTEGALGMLAGHNWYEDLTEERIRFAIRAAKDRDIEIVTLREAFESQGVVQPSTPTKSTPTTTPATTPPTDPADDRSPKGWPLQLLQWLFSVFG